MAEIIVDIGDNLVETIGCEFKGELVRCKECRYKDMEICPMYRLVVAGVRKYDDYCSYGEREGE